MNRSPFPRVFWITNIIEVLERFAYYGIYMGFGIYMTHLGYSNDQLGTVQSVFLLVSYLVPVFSGTFADKYGFKKLLIISYLAYLPSILFLIIAKSFSGIALTMISIAFAAGIFKPLIPGTIRSVTDKTNKTFGFGIYYAMVNVGASFGPLVAGKLRAISWDRAFYMAAISIGLMLIITIFFYKEPKREIEGITLKKKFKDLGVALSDMKFLLFLVLLGFFFWLPFWALFNLLPKYINYDLNSAQLYLNIKSVLGAGVANFLSQADAEGTRRILGETISHTGYIIMIFQIMISRIFEKMKPMKTFLFGLFVAFLGFLLLGYARISSPAWVFLGILFFAFGEMIAAPRVQEYIMWIAPKEKAGLYMGANFLPIALGGFLSGKVYTSYIYNHVKNQMGQPEMVWFILAAHIFVSILVFYIFTKYLGEFKELES